jgi:predicted secreted protein with PEFG-CTERM motif
LVFVLRIVLLVTILGPSIIVPAFAYMMASDNSTNENYGIAMNSSVSPITVTTDSQSYGDGSKIVISGYTRDYIPNMPITVMVRNPLGNIVMVAQVPLGTDKTYSTIVTTGGSIWQAAGTYEVDVTFGTVERSAKTTFQFAGSKPPTPPPNSFAVEGTNYTVTYDITNGKVLGMKTDSQAKSLLVAIQTTGDGMLTITLPRTLVDAKAGNMDDKFFVLVDSQEADFAETNTTTTDRTLSIPFEDGTEEIEIIGTQVVPEFGPLVTLILVIAIMSIIAVTSKIRLKFIS